MMNVTSECLQLLCKHSWLGSKRFLRVGTDWTCWMIHDTIDGSRGWLQSPAAGGVNPANPSSGKSDRWGRNGWQYWDGRKIGWRNGDITVECVYKT